MSHKNTKLRTLIHSYKDSGLTPREIATKILPQTNYSNIESLRVHIYRIMKDEKPKSFASTSSFNEILRELKPENYNPFNLPIPEDDSAKKFKLPVMCNNILFLSDIHVPFHDIPALTVALKKGKERNVNTIYLNGDIMDFYTLSRFVKDKKLRNLPNELEQGREFLKILRDLFPLAKIYYKIGNHDIRWDLHIKNNAGDFEGMDEFALGTMLHLNKYDIELIDSTTVVEIGKLMALHGHELYGTGGVNPARNLWLKVKCSAIMSHVHTTSEHTEVNLKDEIFTTWSTGCLSVLRPHYNPNSRYNHGFAIIETTLNGDFKVENFRINNGKLL